MKTQMFYGKNQKELTKAIYEWIEDNIIIEYIHFAKYTLEATVFYKLK